MTFTLVKETIFILFSLLNIDIIFNGLKHIYFHLKEEKRKEMRKIKIVFHVGRGKTATTFLQKIAQQLENVIFAGKFYPKKDRNLFEESINSLHYQLFVSYRNEVNGGYPNPTVNSFELLEQYAEELKNMIMDNPNAEVLVLSDECISDYANYLGELNTILIIALGNLLVEKLGTDFIVEKTLSLTIRSQPEVAASAFAYTPSIGGTLTQFINSSLTFPKRSLFGGMFYFECYTLYKLIAKDDWDINFTPYELLSIDGDALSYLCSVFKLDRNNINLENIDTQAVNVNSKSIGDKRSFIKRRKTIFGQTGHIWNSSSGNSYKLARSKKQYVATLGYLLKHLLGKILLDVDRLIRRGKLFKDSEFILDDHLAKKIQATYHDDNIKLQEVLNQYDLVRYGYICKE